MSLLPASKKILTLFTLFIGMLAFGQNRTSTKEYIALWSPTAVKNMQQFGIPASIILAQGLLESGAGNSELARKGNNHFGIKCHNWDGAKIYHDDDKKNECFRKYNSAPESFADHVAFLSGSKRYASLFELKTTDYKGWAKGLKKAGYATNPKYPNLLIDIIEKNNLNDFDKKPAKRLAKVAEEIRENEEVDQNVVFVAEGRKENVADKSEKQLNKKEKRALKKEEKAAAKRAKKRKRKEILRQAEEKLPYAISTTENNVEYVEANGGERLRELADAMLLNEWQIKKYNDLEDSYHKFKPGERVYIKPKRRKAAIEKVRVNEKSDLRTLSQSFGIKIKHILRYNPDLTVDSELNPGDVLFLQKP